VAAYASNSDSKEVVRRNDILRSEIDAKESEMINLKHEINNLSN